MLNPLEEICYRVSLKAHREESYSDVAQNPASFSHSAHAEWRSASLIDQFTTNFDPALIAGKRVLDFGCGRGSLSILAAQHGAASVIGMDLEDSFLPAAAEEAASLGLGATVSFLKAKSADAIDLPDSSVDVILCFDVMEHIMEYRRIIPEWHRVLSPGGRVLIWWSVWLHPYGHHQHTMIPLPWVHLFLSDAALLRICARIYERPEFKARFWHFDEQGRRKPNPYANHATFTDLNKLTIRGAEKVFRAAGFQIARRILNPFTGARLALLKRLLIKTPVPDLFCSCVVYELTAHK